MSDHESEWKRYRVRRRWIVASMIVEFLAFIPVVGAVAVVSRKLLSSTDLALPAAVAWGMLYMFTVSRLRKFPCPRCGKNFFGGILSDSSLIFSRPRAFLGRQCAYCGLEKYSHASPSSSESGEYSAHPPASDRAHVSSRNFWLLFAAVQAVGAILPHFGNVNMNTVPVILGGLLLLPGDVVELVYPPNINPWLEIASVILINAAAWYVFRRTFLLDSAG